MGEKFPPGGAFFHLFISLIAAFKNLERDPHGYRYDDLHGFSTLLNFMGSNYFEIYTSNLMFPTYKKQFLIDHGINDDLFNGKVQNVISIMQRYLLEDFD